MSAGSSARSRSRSASARLFEYGEGEESRRVRVSNSVDPAFSDSICEVERDAREFSDGLPSVSIPSTGDRLDDCGDDIRPVFCPDCGGVPLVGRTCRRSRCPRCWRSWAFYSAKTWASKLEGLRASRASDDASPKLHHVVVSLPDSTRFDADDPLDAAFGVVARICDEIDLNNGLRVYHPWRIAEEHRGEVNGHESGDGDLTWKHIYERIEADGWAATRDEYLTFSPHFHVVGVSEFVGGVNKRTDGEEFLTETIERRSGIVAHRITQGDSAVSIYDTDDLAKVVAYALSHAGLVPEGGEEGDDDPDEYRAAYRGFGEVANFTPSKGPRERVDEAMRAVAPDVLGCSFGRPECTEPVPESREADPSALGYHDHDGCAHDHGGPDRLGPEAEPSAPETVAAASPIERAAAPSFGDEPSTRFDLGGTVSSSTWSDVPDTFVPDFALDPSEATEAVPRCGGTLVSVRVADRYLDDDEWREQVGEEAAEEVREARLEWELMDRPEPDNPPPPAD